MDPTDEDIARRLGLLVTVRTEALGVQNNIVEVHNDRVVVQSERTDELRTIPFRDLRRASEVTTNGQIVRVLAVILGLFDGAI